MSLAALPISRSPVRVIVTGSVTLWGLGASRPTQLRAANRRFRVEVATVERVHIPYSYICRTFAL